jgi:hypothetical protein
VTTGSLSRTAGVLRLCQNVLIWNRTRPGPGGEESIGIKTDKTVHRLVVIRIIGGLERAWSELP